MPTGQENLEIFKTMLEDNGLTYAEMADQPLPSLTMGFSLNNIRHLQIFFWFDEDGTSVHCGTGPIVSVPNTRMHQALAAVNQANTHFRWTTFSIDDDGDIIASIDSILIPDHIGTMGKELMDRLIQISDEAYMRISKAIWAGDDESDGEYDNDEEDDDLE